MNFPAWNSLQATGRIHDFSELAAIALFFVVVIFELVAYTYGHRHERLVDEQNAGRHLSDTQKEEFVKILAPFSGQKVTITCIPGNIESDDFARDFYDVIKKANWDYQGEPYKFEKIFTEFPIGVEITLNQSAVEQQRVSTETMKAYNTFINFLRAAGIINPNEPVFVNNSVPSDVIEIRIGGRPPKPGQTSADRNPQAVKPFP